MKKPLFDFNHLHELQREMERYEKVLAGMTIVHRLLAVKNKLYIYYNYIKDSIALQVQQESRKFNKCFLGESQV